MSANKLPEHAVITKALRDLDRQLPPLAPGEQPVELNVVGGYALIIREVRTNAAQLTDIDYIGPDLSPEWRSTIDRIGVTHGLGRGWVNNDVQLSGASLEDMEMATGPLEFEPYESDLQHFKVNIATEATLLRMKLIAVDTSLTAVQHGGDFTRSRDLGDLPRFEARNPGSVQRMVSEMDEDMLLLDPESTRRAASLAVRGVPVAQILEDVGVDLDSDDFEAGGAEVPEASAASVVSSRSTASYPPSETAARRRAKNMLRDAREEDDFDTEPEGYL